MTTLTPHEMIDLSTAEQTGGVLECAWESFRGPKPADNELERQAKETF